MLRKRENVQDVRTDHLGIITALRHGAKWATDLDKPMARLWTMIIVTLDSCNDLHEVKAHTLWMPSHTSSAPAIKGLRKIINTASPISSQPSGG